jgi:hypothetical protein
MEEEKIQRARVEKEALAKVMREADRTARSARKFMAAEVSRAAEAAKQAALDRIEAEAETERQDSGTLASN